MAGTRQTREVTVACRTCKAFGVLVTEGDPIATVCATCHGLGYQKMTFEPFTGRRKRNDITRVRRAGEGISLFGGRNRRKQPGIPYDKFLKGKMP